MIRSAEKNGERTDTMEKSDIRYQAYVSILEEELKPAMGCTEPIAIAYCAAVAREVLGGLPEKVKVGASGRDRPEYGSFKGNSGGGGGRNRCR